MNPAFQAIILALIAKKTYDFARWARDEYDWSGRAHTEERATPPPQKTPGEVIRSNPHIWRVRPQDEFAQGVAEYIAERLSLHGTVRVETRDALEHRGVVITVEVYVRDRPPRVGKWSETITYEAMMDGIVRDGGTPIIAEFAGRIERDLLTPHATQGGT